MAELMLKYTVITVITLHFITDAKKPEIRDTHPFELTIDSGNIRGEHLTQDGEPFTVFKGIPYAAPPVGAYRFKPPQRPAKWRGVMNATQFQVSCAQHYMTHVNTELGVFADSIRLKEDCLYLNVFSPPPYMNESYPVIVFIHGGGFQIGSASDYKQDAIIRHFVSRNTIFVTFNYRLGPLGFISTGDEVIPGNNGLLDMIAALNWVQTNIAQFGGDITRVTVMGHGTGAVSASILALSPRAEGLFRNAILLSGTAVSPGAVRDTAINATWALQAALHCRAFNSSQIIQCLKTRHRNDLFDPNRPRVVYDDYQEWVPVIDGYGGVMPDPPEELTNYRPKVPIMIGTTRDESALRLLIFDRADVNMSALSKSRAQGMVRNLTQAYSGFSNHQLITDGCLYEYVHTRTDPASSNVKLKEGMLEMYSQFWYHSPASRLATAYARDRAPVYLFSFDHVSGNLFSSDAGWTGAFHGSDLIHLFDIHLGKLNTRSDQNWQLDRRVTETFADLITNFARVGNPTPEDSGFAFTWDQFNAGQLNYLSITDSPEMKVGFHWKGHVFWNIYSRQLDAVDVGNLKKIAGLEQSLGDYQLATWILLCCALFFFAILVGLACYCTRKEPEEDQLYK